MSSSDRNSPPLPSPTRRRSSFAGQFVDMFGSRPSNGGNANGQAMPGSISHAAMQAQQRRLSLTTVGLSGSPNATSPFNTGRPRTESLSSSTSGTVDESPFEDGDAPTSSVPASPFARRLSFGARAMRDMRASTGNANANGRPSVSIAKSPPTAKNGRASGSGFDIAENMRSRAERTSISAGSVAQPKRPDAFQERILKGDFYMD